MPMRLDFKAIAESVDVEAVARQMGVPLKRSANELRAACPACETDDDRSLAVYPETNSYRCFAASLSGDSISLWAHLNGYTGMYRAAKELAELFPHATASGTAKTTDPERETVPATPPQKPEARTVAPRAQPAPAFDPDEYAAKLQYTEQVSDLGISQEDAARLGVGYMSSGLHRGRVVFCVRNPDGSISGFVGVNPADIKLPQRWIGSAKVVQLRRA